MAIVLSRGMIAEIAPQWAPLGYGRLRLYEGYTRDYATLYKEQPNVRTCVDFLARNIAQLGLHVFQRRGETDRVRLRDHPLTLLLEKPLPPEFKVTRYRLIECLMGDLGVYFNALWLKVRSSGGNMGLLRIPWPWVTVKTAGLVPTYDLNLGSKTLRDVPATDVVHFRGYNPEDPVSGLSPLETLRRVLAEEWEAGNYREKFWANSARMSGIIERPATAPEWSTQARERFRAEFEALYSGLNNSGKTAILEEGMTWKVGTFNAQESEYLAGRKLTLEECARAYHIPLPMVGILDHATFSNIREQHKNLYQDCLGPWLAMIEDEIELQLLPDLEPTQGVYVEFNIQEKLQGSFDEQTQSLQSAVGRPWMTADEARARMNLPSMGGDAARLVVPLNVLVGGQPSPRSPVSGKATGFKAASDGEIDPSAPKLREQHEKKWAEVLGHFFNRQQKAVLGRMGKKAKAKIGELWDAERWIEELAVDIYALNVATATVWAKKVAEALEIKLDEERMLPYLEENSRIASEEINATTAEQLEDALDEEDPLAGVRRVFGLALAVRAMEIARSKVTTASAFGAVEGARQGGLRTKTWHVNSANPRDAHAALDGETVEIEDRFSNGQLWPGDPAGGAENNANCACSVSFGRE